MAFASNCNAMVKQRRGFHAKEHFVTAPPLDDNAPLHCESALGYCRDLRRQRYDTDEAEAFELPNTLAARLLPKISNAEDAKGDNTWNIHKCELGLQCGDPACPRCHTLRP